MPFIRFGRFSRVHWILETRGDPGTCGAGLPDTSALFHIHIFRSGHNVVLNQDTRAPQVSDIEPELAAPCVPLPSF